MEHQNEPIRVDTTVQTVTVGENVKIFEIMLWVLGIFPGLIFLCMKISAENYFKALEEKIRIQASEIDNYLTQRVVVLKNTARLLERAIELDQSTYAELTKLKHGTALTDKDRNQLSRELDNGWNRVHLLMEQYPQLRAHEAIQEAMHQNLVLYREIAAARSLYNDAVYAWNRDIFQWVTKRVVAAKNQYSTRTPFVASEEIRKQADEVFF